MLNKKRIIGISRKLNVCKFRVGDVLSVKYEIIAVGSVKTFVGICLSKKNKGIATKVILRNVVDNISVEYDFFLFGTDILEVKKITSLKNINVQRGKLYYLRKKKLNMSKI